MHQSKHDDLTMSLKTFKCVCMACPTKNDSIIKFQQWRLRILRPGPWKIYYRVQGVDDLGALHRWPVSPKPNCVCQRQYWERETCVNSGFFSDLIVENTSDIIFSPTWYQSTIVMGIWWGVTRGSKGIIIKGFIFVSLYRGLYVSLRWIVGFGVRRIYVKKKQKKKRREIVLKLLNN